MCMLSWDSHGSLSSLTDPPPSLYPSLAFLPAASQSCNESGVLGPVPGIIGCVQVRFPLLPPFLPLSLPPSLPACF
jgi:hypothetical protein